MHHVLPAAALHAQVQLAALHPLRTGAASGDGAVARGVAAGGGAGRCNCDIGPLCYNCSDSAYSDAACIGTWVRTHELHAGLIPCIGPWVLQPEQPLHNEEFRVATCSPFYTKMISFSSPFRRSNSQLNPSAARAKAKLDVKGENRTAQFRLSFANSPQSANS